MTPRETLHRLVDDLPEQALHAATRALGALAEDLDPVSRVLHEAPVDDEPDADDLDGGLTEARNETARGELLSLHEVQRKLG